MAEYINRDETKRLVNAYIDSSYERADNNGYHEARAEGFEELLDDVFNLSTIELVHCKDCKYFYRYLLTNFKNCELHELPTKEDGFCQWAERRE